MTALAAILKDLLKGKKLSIKTAFNDYGVTNLPREIGRSVVRKFNVSVDKQPTKFKSRYGHTGEYYRYSLQQSKKNRPGISAIKKYIKEQQNTK